MTISSLRSAAFAALLAAGLAGCASNTPLYPTQPASSSSYAREYGRVVSVELLRGENRSGSGVGAVIGGVVGAVVGSQVGGGSGRTAATVVGAVGGALAGNEVEKRRQAGADIHRVLVRLENGEQRQFDYADPVSLRPGDRVYVQDGVLMR
jgi:outer membrane lipoprotein SlyB